MLRSPAKLGLSFALATTSAGLLAQDPGADTTYPAQQLVLLDYAKFDPTSGVPSVPETLRGAADLGLWIVQFRGSPTEAGRDAVRATGAQIHQYLPDDSYVVRMTQGVAAAVAGLPQVRWVGYYEPAYRLEPALLAEHLAGGNVPTRKYNMLVVDKRLDKPALTANVLAIGGKVVERHEGSPLFTVELTGTQLLAAARFDQVLYIDRWTPVGEDMNNARIQGGANHVETQAGYTGSGVRGHVYEGVQNNHPDFTTVMTNVNSSGAAQDHGHCTAGIIFGNGTSHPSARGMAPDAVGFYTTYTAVTGGLSRNQVINNVVNTHNCMFTTASWGGSQTTAYTTTSADADDIVFDHRIPWTNSMSNLGDQRVRPEAWGKNVISIGGVHHFNNSTAADDSWLTGNGSTGPAADGRIKPDLAAYYDNVWTSDRTGADGYDPGNHFTGFNGTSSATPIVAGHNALAIQMFTDFIFGNTPRVSGGTRFQNRPFAQTLKAMMIATANTYTPTATDNRREHVGYGFPSLQNLYDRRGRIYIVPEDVAITQGSTHSYLINVGTGETNLKICMSYLDPMGNPAAAIDRINDLTLRVISPTGTSYWGNNGLSAGNTSTSGGSPNTVDTVECVFIANPAAGNWTVEVTAPTVAQDAHLATGAVDATYALVVNGGIRVFGSGCARYLPDTGPTSAVGNYIPFGVNPALVNTLTTTFAGGNGLANVPGTVFFNVTVANPLWISGLDLSTLDPAGTPMLCDVYRTVLGGGYGGNESNPAAWTALSAGRGVSAGPSTASTIELSEPFLLQAGSYGFAIVSRSYQPAYTNGANVYSDANLTISTGASGGGIFGGGTFSPRSINMSMRYALDDSDWTNQRYQTILRREELGSAGTITGLAFAPKSTGLHYNSSLLIRMSHVPAGHVLSTTFATNLPSPVTVLNSNHHVLHTVEHTWQEIGLNGAFAYNGTSDVVVDIVARGNLHTNPAAFHNDPDRERVYAFGWTGAVPTTGTGAASAALRMRVAFNCADGENYGTSCGPLNCGHSGSGARGTVFRYTVGNALPSSLAFVVLGFNNGAPHPVDLTGFGWTNCQAWNDNAAANAVLTNASGAATFPISIPNTSAFDGVRLYGHWAQLDPSQPGGLTASNYARMIVGLAP
jgi:hypothetical protein